MNFLQSSEPSDTGRTFYGQPPCLLLYGQTTKTSPTELPYKELDQEQRAGKLNFNNITISYDTNLENKTKLMPSVNSLTMNGQTC